jgi:hypothetical protein
MSVVTVIHGQFGTRFEDEEPQVVAEVDTGEYTGEAALHYAYRFTNNIEGSWSIKEEYLGEYLNGDYNENVKVIKPLYKDETGKEWGHRSTSMGDRMICDGKIYEVAAVGFKEIGEC